MMEADGEAVHGIEFLYLKAPGLAQGSALRNADVSYRGTGSLNTQLSNGII